MRLKRPRRLMMSLPLLLLASCSSTPNSIALSERLIPKPAVIPVETQDALPGAIAALSTLGENGKYCLTPEQAWAVKDALTFLKIERDKLRMARAALRE